MTPEDLIRELQDENEKLRAEVEKQSQDIKDFEFLARTWADSYKQVVPQLRIKITNLEQIVQELEKDLEDWKNGNIY